jgi:hypothetical protein
MLTDLLLLPLSLLFCWCWCWCCVRSGRSWRLGSVRLALCIRYCWCCTLLCFSNQFLLVSSTSSRHVRRHFSLVTALPLILRDEGRWGTGRLTSQPSRCLPGRRRWSWVDSRCVWLDQAPPLYQAPLWGGRECICWDPGFGWAPANARCCSRSWNLWKGWNLEKVGDLLGRDLENRSGRLRDKASTKNQKHWLIQLSNTWTLYCKMAHTNTKYMALELPTQLRHLASYIAMIMPLCWYDDRLDNTFT